MGTIYTIIPPPIALDIKQKLIEKAKSTKWIQLAEAFNDHVESNKTRFPARTPLNDRTLRAALSSGQAKHTWGVNQDKPWILEALCDIRKDGGTWEQTLKEFNILPEQIETRNSSTRLLKESKDLSTHLFSIENENIKLLNLAYWESQYYSSMLRTKTTERYYTHIDATQIHAAIANDLIVTPHNKYKVQSPENDEQELLIEEIFGNSITDSFSLIKILGTGGNGKSTFLYWIAKTFCKDYHFIDIVNTSEDYQKAVIAFCKKLASRSPKPFIFLLDDPTKIADASKLIQFIDVIKYSLSYITSITFIITDRIGRFDNHFANNSLDRSFSGNVQMVKFVPPKNELLFEKIYSSLQIENPQLNDPDLKRICSTYFNTAPFESISEKTYLVLEYLCQKKLIIYDFDWIIWNNKIRQFNNQKLEHLFLIVASFYQFGILLNINFRSSMLPGANALDIVNGITSFDLSDSPIVLRKENSFICLRHENLARWFFRIPENRLRCETFLNTFFDEFSDVISAKLFRKLKKILNTPDLSQNDWLTVLPPERCLQIIDRYLLINGILKDEQEKMLTEKAITHLHLGNRDIAINILKEVITNPENNHARDKLARIYMRSEATYQQALDLFYEIYENGEEYALIYINKIIRDSNFRGISLTQKFPLFSKKGLILPWIKKRYGGTSSNVFNTLIEIGDFDTAKKLLNSSVQNRDTAAKYNILANAIRITTKERIRLKLECYAKAATCFYRNRKVNNIKYTIDLSTFLYRLGFFQKSNIKIKALIRSRQKIDRLYIEREYNNRIRSIKSIVFHQMPRYTDVDQFEQFMDVWITQGYNFLLTGRLIPENIKKASLIFRAVRSNSRFSIVPFLKATKGLAYAYMKYADVPWNSNTELKNHEIADELYSQVLDLDKSLSYIDCMYMLKNLTLFNNVFGWQKILNITKGFLANPTYRSYPGIYRFRGVAKKALLDYHGAFFEYNKGLRYSLKFKRTDWDLYKSERTYILNNIVRLICEHAESNIPLNVYTIEDAYKFIGEIKRLNPRFRYLTETKNRLDQINRTTLGENE